MSKSKKMSRAKAFAPNRKLPNRFVLQPLLIPFVAAAIAQDPSQWEEIPIQENLFGGIIHGSAIKLPVLGRSYAIICDGLESDMFLLVKLVSYLSMRTVVRVFRDEHCRFFLCSDADDATIEAAMRYAGNEVFGTNVPYRTTRTTPQEITHMSSNIPE